MHLVFGHATLCAEFHAMLCANGGWTIHIVRHMNLAVLILQNNENNATMSNDADETMFLLTAGTDTWSIQTMISST